MALVQLARAGKPVGDPVLTGSLRMPRTGAWTANLVVGVDRELTGAVDLLVGDTALRGTVSRGAITKGVLRAQVVGGADGMRAKVVPKHYTSPTLGIVLRDVVKDAGEAIASAAAADVLGVEFDHWTTIEMPAGQAIYCLMQFAPEGSVWRLLPDGTLWLGTDAFEDSGVEDFTVLDERPDAGVLEVGLLEPLLFPGTRLGDHKIDSVELLLGGRDSRARIWTVV